MKIYTTNQREHYVKTEKEFACGEHVEFGLIKIYPEEQRQEILGFGGAFTEASAWVWSRMGRKQREELLDLYFGDRGSHYTFCRTHIQSCDFSLGNRSYLKGEDPESFSIEGDRAYLLPFIKAAQEREPGIQFLASPWSPPAFMKSNGEMNHGGILLEEYYDAWADVMVKYVQAYAGEGVPISRMTIQNEPMAVQKWESCIFTGEKEREFACGHLRRKLDQAGLSGVKLAVWDHNKEMILERTGEIFCQEEARQAVDGIAFHWYTGDHFEALAAVREKYPEKELIFTEGCVEYSRNSRRSDVSFAEQYGHALIGDLNAGMNAFMDWNLILDVQGGPNHVGNFCDAPVMCDVEKGEINVKLSYYYIGHFSRFVKPGARRLLTTRYTQNVECCAFRNPDGEMVFVAMNPTGEAQKFKLWVGGRICPMEMEAHSIMTAAWTE